MNGQRETFHPWLKPVFIRVYQCPSVVAISDFGIRVEKTLCLSFFVVYDVTGFGRAENRSWRKSGEESPNSTERDAA